MKFILNALLLLAAFSMSQYLLAKTDKIVIDIGPLKAEITKLDQDQLSVSIDGYFTSMEAGLPSLPFKTYRIALPKGTKAGEIKFIGEKSKVLKGTLKRASSQLPVELLADHPLHLTPAAAPNYVSVYPTSRLRTNLQYLHGVPILLLNFYPIQEVNKEKIKFASKGRIEISLLQDRQNKANFRSPFPHEVSELKSFVNNKDVIDSYGNSKPSSASYDYLIISNNALLSYQGEWDIEAFQKGLDSRNISSRTIAVENILKNTAGPDNQEKIRNYIRDQYTKFGIKFVLLATDGNAYSDSANDDDDNLEKPSVAADNMIPPRLLWSKIRGYLNGHWQDFEENIPADMFYGCLDGPFNGNNNAKWGEPTDGLNGKDVDLLAEVIVGRIPLNTVEDIKNFARKTLWVNSNLLNKKALMAGEMLFSELNIWGDYYMDQLIGQCSDHGYPSNGYSSEWKFDKLYDKQAEWSGDDVMDHIAKNNYSMINHLGHSYIHYNMKIDSDDSGPLFENTTPFFHYTQGCFPGDFTAKHCFIENMLEQQNGAFASIANTSYGLCPEDPKPSTTSTPGASQMLHRRFITGIFHEGMPRLGVSHQKSKEYFTGFAGAQEMRWAFWVSNYFGDPSLELHFR